MKVVMYRGLPGSGKTTTALEFLAEHPDYRRVNKDELRKMLYGSNKPKNNEKYLDKIQQSIIIDLLIAGFSVIVDNTNLSPRREQELRDLVDSFNEINQRPNRRPDVEFEVKFFDTPVWQCIINDASRGTNAVGAKVIGRMYEQFLKPKPIPYNPELPDAYLFDLDGSYAIHEGRSPYDYTKLGTDSKNPAIQKIINMIGASNEVQANKTKKIIFVSGRPSNFIEETSTWIGRLHDNYDLHMRDEGDNRKDAIVKREIYDREIAGKFNILGVFDDRLQVVEMWRALGLPVFHVDYGFF